QVGTELSQWASYVIDFSSEYDTDSWSANQALGEPDTFDYGDIETAWTSQNDIGTIEYITVGFDLPVLAYGALIRETDGNGFVVMIETVDLNDGYQTVWEGVDDSLPGTPVDFVATWETTTYAVKGLRITVDTDHDLDEWEQIDAIQLIGTGVAYLAINQPTDNSTLAPHVQTAGATLSVVGNLPTDTHWEWLLNTPFPSTGFAGGTNPGAGVASTNITGLSSGFSYTVYVAVVNDSDGTIYEPLLGDSNSFSVANPGTLIIEELGQEGLSFGSTSLISGTTTTLYLANGDADGAISILDVYADDSSIVILSYPSIIYSGMSEELVLKFLPTQVGPVSGTITIEHDGIGGFTTIAFDGEGTTEVNFTVYATDGLGYEWDIEGSGYINDGSNDAYDGGLELYLDGAQFPYFDSGSVDDPGEVSVGHATHGVLDVERRVYISQTSSFARFLEILSNPTGTPQTVQVQIYTNLGSDSNTTVLDTSSGDTTFTTADNWLITDDSTTGSGGGDPVVVHVIAGSGAPTSVSTATTGDPSEDDVDYTYEVAVPAYGQATVMHFAAQRSSLAEAQSIAMTLESLGGDALGEMDSGELATLTNFAPIGVDPNIALLHPQMDQIASNTNGVLVNVALSNVPSGAYWAWQLDMPFPSSGAAGGIPEPSSTYVYVTGLTESVSHTVYVTLVDSNGDVLQPAVQDNASFLVGDETTSISTDSSMVSFADVAVEASQQDGENYQYVDLSLSGLSDIGILAATSDNPVFVVIAPSVFRVGSYAHLVIAMNTSTVGFHEGTITITDDGAGVPIQVYVSANVIDAVQLEANITDGLGYTWHVNGTGVYTNDYNSSLNAITINDNGVETDNLGTREDVRDGIAREIAISAYPYAVTVDLTRKIYVPDDAGFARFLDVFTNLDTVNPLTISVTYSAYYDGAYYYGAGSTLAATSSGDLTLDTSDYWFVTSATSDGEGGVAASVGHVFAGIGGSGTPTSVGAHVEDPARIDIQFDVTIPPSGSVTLVHLAVQRDEEADALAMVEYLADLPYESTIGMSSDETDAILNFAYVANSPPTANATSEEVDEDVGTPITISGVDPESQPLSFSLLDDGSPVDTLTTVNGGTVALTDADANDSQATATYTPAADYYGPDSFEFIVSDGVLTSDPATVTIIVAPINDPPSMNELDDLALEEDPGVQSVPLTNAVSGPVNEMGLVTITAVSDNLTLIDTVSVGEAGSARFLAFTPLA
ncbi:MAG: Ig-like domain-containing protein, partial [Candidatus Poribacteria bacterium]|nr:Ig-like domain-containing protein [Candidatus Poribacteria bacterium]